MSAKLLSMTGEPVEITRPISIEELRDRSGFDHVSVLETDTVLEGRVVPRTEQTTVPVQMMVMLSEVGEMHRSSFFERLASDFRPFIFSTDDEAVVPEFMPSNYSDHVLVEVLHSIGICGGYAIPLQESDGRRFVMIYTTSDATRLHDDPQLVLDTMEWFHQRDSKRRLPCASSECPLEGHQFQVLLALARGFTPTQIAGALNVSEFTIREYARLIREETGTKTNAQATARAAQLGWLPYV